MPDDLRAIARDARAASAAHLRRARELIAAQDYEAAKREIDLAAEADGLVMWAEKRSALHPGNDRSTLGKQSKQTMELSTEHRMAISKGRVGKDPFMAAIRPHTMTSLAKALGVSKSILSRNRTDRPCPRARAERIAELTQGRWPADRKHWPTGLV